VLSAVNAQDAVVQPERSELQKLEQADRLFENGHAKEAAQLLGQLLENCQNGTFYVPPAETTESEKPEAMSAGSLMPFRSYLIGKLAKLPKEAKESYGFQFETLAKRLLGDAVQAGNEDAIADVARKYFPTRAGAEAALTVALLQFERGDNEAALLTVQSLRSAVLNKELQSALHTEIDSLLKRIEERQKNAANVNISEADFIDIIGWRMPGGVSNQNPNTNISPPILERCWDVPVIKPFWENDVAALQQNIQNSPDTYIPAPMPLIAGGVLITRCADDITAIDLHSGKRLWSASEPQHQIPPPYWVAPFSYPWQRYGGQQGQSQRNSLRFILWHNRIPQQLSGSGNLCFSIDGHELFPMPGRSNPAISLGGKLYEDRRYEAGNTLTARSIQTGEIVWQSGKFPLVQKYLDACAADADNAVKTAVKAKDDKDTKENEDKNAPFRPNVNRPRTIEVEAAYNADEKQMLETWFLGVPLPLNGKLYVIGETSGLIQLFVLNPQNGALIRRAVLAQASRPIETDFLRRTYPLTPSAYGGLVICPTGSGLTVALDAATLSPLWCYNYTVPQAETPNVRLIRNQIQHLVMPGNRFAEQQYRQIFAECGWQMPGILIDGGVAVIAPPDRAGLFCLDLLTGNVLWKKNIGRAKTLYPACIRNGNVFVVTPDKMLAFDLKTGNTATPNAQGIVFPRPLRPCGIGVAGGNSYFMPMSGGYLARINLDDLTGSGRIDWQSICGQAAPEAEAASAADGSPFGAVDGEVLDPDIPPGAETMVNASLGTLGGNASENNLPQRLFGNLAGVQGRVFSQSPLNVMCFDQKAALAKRTDAALKTNPNDAGALLQHGRVLFDNFLQGSGNLSEAVAVFRQSLKAKPGAEAADALRRCLLEAVRKDYAAWSSSAGELLSLAELPEETAEILYALAEGSLKAGQKDKYDGYVKQADAMAQQQPVMVTVSAGHTVQLRYAFRCLTPKPEPQVSGLPSTPAVQSQAAIWNTGQVNVDEATEIDAPTATPDQRENEAVARLLRLVKNAGQFNPAAQRPVPYLGTDTLPVRFSLDTTASDLFLVCYDNNGREQGRLPMPEGHYANERYIADRNLSAPSRFAVQTQFLYLTGSSKALILVRDNTVTSFKIDSSEPVILWKKTFTGYLPQRQNSIADSPRFIPLPPQPQSARCFPESSVFASPDVICVEHSGTLIGLEPQSGQTLWTRTLPQEDGALRPALLGDDRHLFVVFPESRRTLALDPLSGAEIAEGHIPTGGIYCYKTNIVFIAQEPVPAGRIGLPDTYRLSIGDLNDLFDKRKRALLVSDTQSTLPVQSVYKNLDSRSLMKMLQNNRYLAILTGKENSLQIIDLAAKQNVFQTAIDKQSRTTVAPAPVNSSPDFDVEFIAGNRFLVYLVQSIDVGNTNPQELEENGTKFQRQYSPLNAVLCRGIGSGQMMLFEADGKPCWKQWTEITNWYRLMNVPADLPVSLFAVSISDTVKQSSETTFSTGLLGIDKLTGETRFRKLIPQLRLPNQSLLPLQNFRIEADTVKQEIHFIAPNPVQPRVVKAYFTPAQ
jgi:outer membrane protein assembly factor BamB